MRQAVILLLLSFFANPPGIQAQDIQLEPIRQAPVSMRVQSRSYDAGDFYVHEGRAVPLSRSLEDILVKFRPQTGGQRKQELVEAELPDAETTDIRPGRGGSVSLVRIKKAKDTDEAQQRDKLENGLRRLREKADVEYANPVFVDPVTGSRLLPLDEISIKIRAGANPDGFLTPRRLEVVEAVRYTDDEYVVRVLDPKTSDLLAVANELARSGLVEWAEPNFVQEYTKSAVPNDPLFNNQWHLNNTGQSGGAVDADVDAVEAWDLTTGSTSVVIAVLDDGVQTTHPDLADRIYTNAAEVINGLDDDGNGYIDDRNGWDFYGNDNNANPTGSDDAHGTSVAGVAAASGNNAAGVSGACQNCRILPVKICYFDDSESGFVTDSLIADAIRYAARFADVLNNSWGGGAPSSAIQSAIQYAKSNGRAGKGSVVLFATGNSATGARTYTLTGVPAGTHKFRWRYVKDGDLSAGDDTVWLAWVSLPGGALVDFQAGWPTGSSTAGNALWNLVDDRYHSDDSLNYTWAAKAGTITHSQYSDFDLVRTVPAGTLKFSAWVSSEQGYDGFRLYLDLSNDGTFDFIWPGTTSAPFGGIPAVTTAVGYPAAHPEPIAVGASSDRDYRSGYSEYGPELDVVAPSSGGPGPGITTTDRTGGDGYSTTGDYTSGFGGTSSATPLASGVVGLMLSRNPDLTADQVQQILQNTADKIGTDAYSSGRNDRYGYGRINAYAAVLASTKYSLTVSRSGTGSGTVTSSPGGINCGSDCGEDYLRTTVVTLTASAADGSGFAGWSGSCSGSDSTCSVTMDQARSVTATFNLSVVYYQLTVTSSGTGSGLVLGDGINCGSDCSESYLAGTVVNLAASPTPPSEFVGFSGACSGSTCQVTMDSAKSVTATFDIPTHQLSVTVEGEGTGTVTSSPAGINCGADCAEVYNHGQEVTLTAAPASGSIFAGWDGACSGTELTCSVLIDAAKTVTASFSLRTYQLSVAKEGSGSGSVSSSPPGIDCGADCTAAFDYGTVVTLTATPHTGSDFTGWSGGCSGAETSCEVTVSEAREVTATFRLKPTGVDVFFTGPDKGLYQLNTDRDATDTAVAGVAGGGSSSHAPALAVYQGRQYLAIKGATSSSLSIKSRARDGSFGDSNWTQVPGGTSSSPALCVFNNRLYLFVKGGSGAGLYYRSMDSSGAWSGWTQVSGSNTLWRPGLVLFGGRLYLFETNAVSNRLWYKSMDESGTWGEWFMIPTGSTNAAPTPVVRDGKIWLFVKGLAGKLLWWSATTTPDMASSWGPWTSCSGSSEAAPGVAFDPAENVFHLVVRGNMVPRIWHRTFDPATLAWSNWHLLTNLDAAAQSIDAPTVVPADW